MGARP
ncbi:bacterial regulatory helix-turn-helix, lysR family protein, partial [Yersinia pestis PY-60]